MADERIEDISGGTISALADGDLLIALDVSDTAEDPQGTVKNVAWSTLVASNPLANGLALEKPSITIVDATGLKVDVEADGGGDIRFLIGGVISTLDCTTGAGAGGKARVAITAGSDANNPQINYLYATDSGGTATLTAATSLPTGAFAWVGAVLVPDATTWATTGAYKFQRYTESVNDSRGQISHERQRVRALPAQFYSGCAPTVTVTPGSPDTVHLEVAAGKVYQLHLQDFPAFTTGPYYWGASTTKLYDRETDANAFLEEQDGTSLSGKYFNLVLWGAINVSAGECKLFVNPPTGSYNNADNAKADSNNTADYSVPDDMRSVAFLIARVVFRHQTAGGGDWTEQETYDLRGQAVGVRTGGVSAAAQNEFLDSAFRVNDNGDETKQLAFELSGLTTATTRTLTVPDVTGTLIVDPVAGTTITFAGAGGLTAGAGTDLTLSVDTAQAVIATGLFEVRRTGHNGSGDTGYIKLDSDKKTAGDSVCIAGYGVDSADADAGYGWLRFEVEDPTTTSHDGAVILAPVVAGNSLGQDTVRVNVDGVQIESGDLRVDEGGHLIVGHDTDAASTINGVSYSAHTVGQIVDPANRAYFNLEAAGGVHLSLTDSSGGADDKRAELEVDGGIANFRSLTDAGGVQADIWQADLGTGRVAFGGNQSGTAQVWVRGGRLQVDNNQALLFLNSSSGTGLEVYCDASNDGKIDLDSTTILTLDQTNQEIEAHGSIHYGDHSATISANAATLDYGASNVWELDLAAATGDVTVTLTEPEGSLTGALKITQDTDTPRDITWATTGAATVQFPGTEPTWNSMSPSSEFALIVDYYKGSNTFVLTIKTDASGQFTF